MKYSKTPNKAPNILDGIPSIIVILRSFSKIPDININTFRSASKIASTKKKAITSYTNIFKTVTPLKIPPNLKKGRFSYINTDTGFLKINASITTKIRPTEEINCLVNPLLNPTKAPNTKNTKISTSTIFI